MGYTEDAPVSLGRQIRRNENCVWVADPEMNEIAFERCRFFLPNGTDRGPPVGLNARLEHDVRPHSPALQLNSRTHIAREGPFGFRWIRG